MFRILSFVLLIIISSSCFDGFDAPPPAAIVKAISGTAAAGSAISGNVTVKGRSGNTNVATIETDGHFYVVVDELEAPFILLAEGTVNGNSVKYFSSTNEAKRTNVNQLTNLILANVLDSDPESAFNDWRQSSDYVTIAALAASEFKVRTQIRSILVAVGLPPDSVDLLSLEFEPNGNGFDKVLDMLDIAISGTDVTITDTVTQTTVVDDLTETNATVENSFDTYVIAQGLVARNNAITIGGNVVDVSADGTVDLVSVSQDVTDTGLPEMEIDFVVHGTLLDATHEGKLGIRVKHTTSLKQVYLILDSVTLTISDNQLSISAPDTARVSIVGITSEGWQVIPPVFENGEGGVKVFTANGSIIKFDPSVLRERLTEILDEDRFTSLGTGSFDYTIYLNIIDVTVGYAHGDSSLTPFPLNTEALLGIESTIAVRSAYTISGRIVVE